MPRSFSALRDIVWPASGPFGSQMRDPRMLVRAGLGLLLAANLAAAAFAFHFIGVSPEALNLQLASSRAQLPAAQLVLKRSRLLTSNIDKGKTESERFLTTYFSNRRYTFSTIINEI